MNIHYCWFGKNKKPRAIKKCIKSWQKYYSDFQIIEWNEDNFDLQNAPAFVKESYQKKIWAYVADYARIAILYDYGGIYLDTDMLAIRAPDNIILNNNIIAMQGPGEICGGIIKCEQHNPLLLFLLEKYKTASFKENASFICDWIIDYFKEFCDKKLDETTTFKNFIIFDSSYFIPKRWNWVRSKFKTKQTYFIHLFLASWKKNKYTFKNRVFQFMCRILGVKLAYHIFRKTNC